MHTEESPGSKEYNKLNAPEIPVASPIEEVSTSRRLCGKGHLKKSNENVNLARSGSKSSLTISEYRTGHLSSKG